MSDSFAVAATAASAVDAADDATWSNSNNSHSCAQFVCASSSKNNASHVKFMTKHTHTHTDTSVCVCVYRHVKQKGSEPSQQNVKPKSTTVVGKAAYSNRLG